MVNRGLISQQGTQVEPCYRGKLYCFVHNFSASPVELHYKDPLASIEFSYVSCFCNEDKRKEIIEKLRTNNSLAQRYDDDRYCFSGVGIKDIRYFKLKRTLPHDCGLFSFANELPRQVKAAVASEEILTELRKKVNRPSWYDWFKGLARSLSGIG